MGTCPSKEIRKEWVWFCYGGIIIIMGQTHSVVAGFWLLGLVEHC